MKTQNTQLHKSVLVGEVLEAINPQPHKTYIDATFGAGGHSRAILEKEKTCKIIAIDFDKTSLELHAPLFEEEFKDRISFIWGNFASLYILLKKRKIKKVDGILADFGTSQYQIKEREGLSFRSSSPLDMRMSKSHYYITAEHVLNTFSEKQLSKIFFELGEEKNAKAIARAIALHRLKSPLKTTLDLARLIESLPLPPRKNAYRIHPATKVFQALRIFVNKELENIELFLPAALTVLTPNAPLVCISFHSLEDRIVKTFFKNHENELEILTKKPIIASEDEIAKNPSARSAKLRVAKKRPSDSC